MAWIIYIAWAYSYLENNPDVADDRIIQYIEIVVLSILSAVTIFFLSLTMARRE
jgi:hypothetical protein